jgi:hypothetical protein
MYQIEVEFKLFKLVKSQFSHWRAHITLPYNSDINDGSPLPQIA